MIRPRLKYMKPSLLVVAALLWVLFAGGSPCGGQTVRSGSGDVTSWSQLPPPPLMTGIGDATLKITTTSPQAQAYFNQGLRLLHAFWYFEAYRAFQRGGAARSRPRAWLIGEWLKPFRIFLRWGSRRRPPSKRPSRTPSHLSGQEQYYIRATAALLENPTDQGRDTYVREMQALVKEYPGDLNAPAFLAFFVMSGFDPDGKPTPGEIYAQTLLRRILASHPENVAANHYWIHAVEGGPNPQSGLRSVAVLIAGRT